MEMTRQRRAAEKTDERAFFIGEVNRFQVDFELDAVFLDRFQHFQRSHHA
jgi:hypothetical protein